MIDILSLTNIFGIFGASATTSTTISTAGLDNFAYDEMGFDTFPTSNTYGPTPDLSGSVILPSVLDLSGTTIMASDDLSGTIILVGVFDLSGSTIMNP